MTFSPILFYNLADFIGLFAVGVPFDYHFTSS